MLGGAVVTWASKRQPLTAISSTESELYNVSQCALDYVYLSRLCLLVMESMAAEGAHAEHTHCSR